MEYIKELTKFYYDDSTYNSYHINDYQNYYNNLKKGLDSFSIDLLSYEAELLRKIEKVLISKYDEIKKDGTLLLYQGVRDRLKEDGLTGTEDYLIVYSFINMKDIQCFFIEEAIIQIRMYLGSANVENEDKANSLQYLRYELDRITLKPYLTKNELCAYLGITENTFNQNYRNRIIKGETIPGGGKTLIYTKEEILEAKKKGRI